MRWFDVAWCYLDWWLWDCCVSQRPSVSRMRRFCRHFLWEPRPAFTSVTSDLSSHGELWVHTCTDAQHLGPYSAAACFFSDCGEFSCECVCEPVVDYKDAPACNIWFCEQQMPEMIWFTWSFSHGHKSECACLSSGNDSAHERGVFHRLTVLEKKGLLCTMVCQVNTICA